MRYISCHKWGRHATADCPTPSSWATRTAPEVITNVDLIDEDADASATIASAGPVSLRSTRPLNPVQHKALRLALPLSASCRMSFRPSPPYSTPTVMVGDASSTVVAIVLSTPVLAVDATVSAAVDPGISSEESAKPRPTAPAAST